MIRPYVGLLGGTFDPIHTGHLAVAHAGAQAFGLDIIRFIPSARPPHRTDSPQASGYHRLAMIDLAVAGATDRAGARWETSDLELRRNGPSFTFDTLSALHREGLAPLQLVFLIGADAFAEIATWHRYPEVLDSAHFAVVSRPGTTLDDLRERLPALASRMSEPLPLESASTPRVFLIASPTPDVSSTEIRRRAARGESLDGLVPAAVAAYIAHNLLYQDRTVGIQQSSRH
jgi:nicotinate-nucleotide adenylyltransferase